MKVIARICFAVFFLAGLVLASSSNTEQVVARVRSSSDVAVVVNPQNDTEELSQADLRKIVLGEKRFWKNKSAISVVLREPGTRERDAIVADTVKMSDSQFHEYWHAKIFRGEASAEPLVVPSTGMATQVVFDSPGAVSFVVGQNVRPDLKVLKIDGKLPGDPGYLLK